MRHRMAPSVVGYDLSIHSAGVVVLHPDWQPGDWTRLSFATFGFDKKDTRSDTERFKTLAGEIVGFVADLVESNPTINKHPMHLFVEGYAYDQARFNPVSFTRLVELAAIVKLYNLDFLELPTHVVNQASWKKLLIGFARRKNVDVKAVCQERVMTAGAPFKTGDECDALGIASYGRSELGLSAISFA